MHRFRTVSLLSLIVIASLCCAQDGRQEPTWPSRSLRLIAVGAPGGSVDIPARVIAERLKDRLGQPVLVENRPQAGGTLGSETVARAAADGYTLLLAFNGPLANAPHFFPKLGYNPLTDFSPIIQTSNQPFVLAVSTASGMDSVTQFIDSARKAPGKLNYASLGNGSGSHLSMELLKTEARLYVLHIPYNGAPAAAAALAGGEVHAAFLPPAALLPYARAGRIKLLAVSGRERFALLRELPSVREAGASAAAGLRDFDADAWNGLLAPAGTPRAIIERLNQEVQRILALPEVRELFERNLIQPAGGSSEAFGRLIQSEFRKWGPVIRYTGAKPD